MKADGNGGLTVPSLNEYQLRALLASCHHIDKLLSETEGILNAAESRSVFRKYVDDLSPVKHKTVQDHIDQIRAQMLRVLAGQGVQPDKPTIAASHAIHATLTFVEIAVEELSPSRMRGYGEVSETAIADLNGLVQELHSSAQQLHRYVLQDRGPDLARRLANADTRGGHVELLRRIEEIVTRRGLVEFRSTLAMLLDSLEDNSFEIAVFGRVNSGKSSLLNHMIGTDILPVGVTPITAVPTRVCYGKEPLVTVWREGHGPETANVDQLAQFVDERLNAGNCQRVSKIVVQYPSPQLREGIVLVDTPGIGSVLRTVTAEAMAYLPRCDAGFVLIDAASAFTPDDLKLVQALLNSSIPAYVALSKADLLAPADLERVQEYARRCIKEALGVDVPVRPVSVLPSHKNMLRTWVDEDISQLYTDHRDLRVKSVDRKILALRDAVCAALLLRLEGRADIGLPELERIENKLRHASGVLEAVQPKLRDMTDQMRRSGSSILRNTAELATQRLQTESEIDIGDLLWKTATEAALETSGSLHGELEQLGRSLREALGEAGLALRFSDTPTEEELPTSRELPAFQLNRAECRFGKGKLLHALGHSLQAARARRELEGLRPALETALQSYAALLDGWTGRALRGLADAFNSYAGRYRAAVTHLSGGPGLSAVEEEAVRKEIELLTELSNDIVRVA